MNTTVREFLRRWFGFASLSNLRVERFFDVHPTDLTPAESEGFEQRKRELLTINMPPVAAALAVAALVFWPFDLSLFAGYPEHFAIFSHFRIFVAAFLFLGLLISWRTGLIHRAPEYVAGAMAVLGIGATGWFMARLEGMDGPWFTYVTATPLTTILILTSLRVRVLINFAAMAAALLGAVLADPKVLDHVWRDSIITQYCFTTLLGIMTGHVVFLSLRASAVSHKRVEASRRALEALSGELESRVEARTRELRAVLGAAEDVRERERSWVVREIHDALGQELLGVSLSLDVLRKQVSAETATHAFEPVEELLARASSTVRRILQGLSATIADEVAVADAMADLVRETAERANIVSTFTCHPTPFGRLVPGARQCLYRVLQEAITNVLRHAHAGRLDVRLARTRDSIVLEVEDDGRGFDAAHRVGIGMTGIGQRANESGGTATWTQGPAGNGTLLKVTIPCQP